MGLTFPDNFRAFYFPIKKGANVSPGWVCSLAAQRRRTCAHPEKKLLYSRHKVARPQGHSHRTLRQLPNMTSCILRPARGNNDLNKMPGKGRMAEKYSSSDQQLARHILSFDEENQEKNSLISFRLSISQYTFFLLCKGIKFRLYISYSKCGPGLVFFLDTCTCFGLNQNKLLFKINLIFMFFEYLRFFKLITTYET